MISFIHIQKLRNTALVPAYGSAGAAGADLFACLDNDITIEPGCTAFVPTGIAMEIPQGFAGLIYARSGLACKRDLAPANKVGVVDSDYRGEVMVALHNHGVQSQTICHGDRIAQLLISPVFTPDFILCEELTATQRNAGGFGSTGR